jgi:hypothetical protein
MHRSFTKISLLRPNSYTDAKGWDDLVDASIGSLKHSSLDEMILLLHTSVTDPREQRSQCVRPVTYNTLGEMRQLLLSTAPGAPRTGATPARQQRQHVKMATGLQSGGDRGRRAQQKYVEMPQERVNDGTEAEAFASGEEYEQDLDETRIDTAKTTQWGAL